MSPRIFPRIGIVYVDTLILQLLEGVCCKLPRSGTAHKTGSYDCGMSYRWVCMREEEI